MGDRKTKVQLQTELEALRQHLSRLEAQIAKSADTPGPGKIGSIPDPPSLPDPIAYSHLLIDSSLDMIIAVDKERRITEFNHAAEQVFGYLRKELLGRRVDLLYANPEEGDQVHHTTREQGRLVVEITNVRRNGEQFPSLLSASVLLDENEQYLGVMGVSRDITERKEAERSLQDTKESLATAQRIAHLGSWDWDIAKNETVYSEEAYHIFGIPPGEHVDFERFINLIQPDERKRLDRAIKAALDKKEHFRIEVGLRAETGDQKYIEAQGELILDAHSGQPVRMVGTIRDITERVIAGQAIQQRTEDILLLNDINHALNRGESLSMVIKLFSDRTRDHYSATGVTGAAVFLLTDDSRYLEMQNLPLKPKFISQIERLVKRTLPKFKLPLDPGSLHQEVMAAGRAQVFRRKDMINRWFAEFVNETWVSSPTLLNRLRKLAPRVRKMLDVESLLVIPLYSGAEAVGLMEISSEIDFTVDDMKRMELVAGQLTAAIIRKKAEDNLLFKQFSVDRTVDAVFWIEAGARLIDVSETACRVLGYTRDELLNMTLHDIDPNFPEENWSRYWAELKEKGSLLVETEHRTKNGFLIPVEVMANYLEFEGKEYNCVFARDISKRKRAEAIQATTYRLSEAAAVAESLPSLYHSIHLALTDLFRMDNFYIALFDKDSETLSFPYYVDQYDEPPVESQPIGKGLTDYVLRTRQPLLVRPGVLDELIKAGEVELIGTKGVDWLGVPLMIEDQIIGVMAVQSYIEGTRYGDQEKDMLMFVSSQVALAIERKAAEEQLREQAALLEKSQDAILVRDLEERIVFWNSSAERLYGWTTEETVGKVSFDLLFDERPADLELARNLLENTGEWRGELHQITKTGQVIIVESSWTAVYDEAGRHKSTLVINTNITERRELEQQILRKQRMESLGTLAGGIAHDLNNILTPITLALPLIQDKYPDEKSRLLLETIQANALRGADIVKQVITFARGVEAERSPLAPWEIVEEVIGILKHTFPKSVKIETRCGEQLDYITGNSTQLHQVILNLCLNARDAMPNGGTLALEAENSTIAEDYARGHPEALAGEYVKISVSDDGTGMTLEVMDKIFEPFFSTKEVGQGTGLGLSVIHSIVQTHNGFIDVESEVDAGSRFNVFLPKATEEHSEESRTTKAKMPEGHGELILVVDDEQSIRDVTREILLAYGYTVETAKDGYEAIKVFKSRSGEVAAVLTDMIMPELDGRATIDALRKIDPKVPIIAASGLASEKSSTETDGGLGADAFLTKPYSAQTLLEAIYKVTNHLKK